MRVPTRTAVALAGLVATVPLFVASPRSQVTISSDAAEVQVQLGDLLYEQGRFPEAFEAYDMAAAAQESRIRRPALAGRLRSELRMAEFTEAYADAADLYALTPEDPDTLALYGDALWAVGRFEDSEEQFAQALERDPESARARHGHARSLAAQSRLDEALAEAQAALRLDPRDAEIHYTVGAIYRRMNRFDEAATAYSSYVSLLPNNDRTMKAAWSRAEIEFLRAFEGRVPFEMAADVASQLHTIPFRTVNEKVVVDASVNGSSPMDFVLDTGAELTVITQDVAERLGVRKVSETISAGVGDFGLRGLELGRIDRFRIGTLELRNVPCLIKNPPLRGLPRNEVESFSPVALGLSAVIDYGRQELLVGQDLPEETADIELPLRFHRLAMVQGTVNGGPANFVVDTGGQVISISLNTASGLEQRDDYRHIPLRVYGTSGWDRDAFLLPGVNLAFQRIEYSNFPVVVLNLRAPSVLLGFQLGGIVGHRFLSSYRVAIDLKRSQLRMTALPS